MHKKIIAQKKTPAQAVTAGLDGLRLGFPRILAFDVDGTLVQHGRQGQGIIPLLVKTLEYAHLINGRLVLVSGSSLEELRFCLLDEFMQAASLSQAKPDDLFRHFEIYANGGTVKAFYNQVALVNSGPKTLRLVCDEDFAQQLPRSKNGFPGGKGAALSSVLKNTGTEASQLIFFGDSLHPDGNDREVLELGQGLTVINVGLPLSDAEKAGHAIINAGAAASNGPDATAVVLKHILQRINDLIYGKGQAR
ncbi:MAG: hypothetical protein WC838_05185 [Candidatus Margulisiibacteriota bacterium]